MSDTGHMNFFKIDRCGLYRAGGNKTYGCEVDETFSLISSWLDGRPFASTIPWDAKEAKSNKPSAYCKDIFKDDDTGDFFLVLWKSDPGGVEGLWGVPEDEAGSGSQVVKHNGKHRGKKVIWGRPCYYWVIPEYNVIVSIKFDHSVCDAQLFQDYVVSCISNRVKHPNRERTYTEQGHVRLAFVGESDEKYRFSFSMSLKIMETAGVGFQELSKRVTHIVKRETVRVDSQDARAEWVKKFTDLVPYVSVKSKSKSRKIEIKAEAKPSVEEIREIVEKTAKEGRSKNNWDNVGFETEAGIVWVDKYRLKNTVKFINRKKDLISAKELHNKIKDGRHNYVAKLKEEFSLRSSVSEAVK